VSGLAINVNPVGGGHNCNAPPSVVGASIPGINTLGTTVVTGITLPNGQQYKFDYDGITGLLKKITYPSGGYVQYMWNKNPQSSGIGYNDHYGQPGACGYTYDTMGVSQRTVSYDGSTTALQQTFSYSTQWNNSGGNGQEVYGKWTSRNTTVLTQDAVTGVSTKTVYSYSWTLGRPAPYFLADNSNGFEDQISDESTIQYFGNAPSYPLLKTVTKGWIGTATGVPLLGCQFETLDNNQVSGAYYEYGSGFLLTDVKQYDFGQLSLSAVANCLNGNPGPVPPTSPTPARESLTTYQSFPSSPVFSVAPYLFDRPASVQTFYYGTLAAETDYSYDQTSVSSVSNLAAGSHDETHYSPAYNNRGNATTVTHKCLQSCTSPAATLTYDETGQVVSKKDACGNATCNDMSGTNHTTSFSYNDNYDSNPTFSTNALLKTITNPLGQSDTFKYAFSDGQLLQSTDRNGQSTSYTFADLLRRLTETDYPDNGKTTLSYNDTPPKSVRHYFDFN
jgi:YD repeat-containing protein